MKTPKLPPLPPSEITPPERYFIRREIMAGLAGDAALAIGPTAAGEAVRLKHSKNARFSASDPSSSRKDITTYKNFYEFGTDKADPARLGGRFRPQPWRVRISGEAEVTGDFGWTRPCIRSRSWP